MPAGCWRPARRRRSWRESAATSLEEAFIALLPEEERRGHRAPGDPAAPGARRPSRRSRPQGLTRRFGDFTAVDHVSFAHRARRDLRLSRLQRLRQDDDDEDADRPAAGRPKARPRCSASRSTRSDIETRKRVGYMSQAFSLYGELTVRQNLELHARLFHLPAPRRIPGRDRGADQALRPRRACRRARREPAARHSPAPVARRRGHPRARDADPRRADLGRRPGRPRRVLGAADRPLAPATA